MEIVRTRVTKETKLKEALKTMERGDIIRFRGGQEWKILDKTEDGKEILIWKCGGIDNHVFNEDGSNVYEDSDIQKYLEGEFWQTVPDEIAAMVDDQGFFLLTAEQVKLFMPTERERIATDLDGYTTWWWTSTPGVGGGSYVRYVHPSGYIYGNNANSSNGVAPACVINP